MKKQILSLFLLCLCTLCVQGQSEETLSSRKVVEYQGQTLLEVDTGFLDPLYDYYEYHGPLFRGNERLYSSQYTHIWGDYE